MWYLVSKRTKEWKTFINYEEEIDSFPMRQTNSKGIKGVENSFPKRNTTKQTNNTGIKEVANSFPKIY